MKKHIYFLETNTGETLPTLPDSNTPTSHERKEVERRKGSEMAVGPQQEPFAETTKGDTKARPKKGNRYMNHRRMESLTFRCFNIYREVRDSEKPKGQSKIVMVI